MVEGTAEQWVDREKRTLKAGECAFIPENVVHAIHNVSKKPMTFLAILSPAEAPGPFLIDCYNDEPWRSLRSRSRRSRRGHRFGERPARRGAEPRYRYVTRQSILWASGFSREGAPAALPCGVGVVVCGNGGAADARARLRPICRHFCQQRHDSRQRAWRTSCSLTADGVAIRRAAPSNSIQRNHDERHVQSSTRAPTFIYRRCLPLFALLLTPRVGSAQASVSPAVRDRRPGRRLSLIVTRRGGTRRERGSAHMARCAAN